jgi:hypothetical protein
MPVQDSSNINVDYLIPLKEFDERLWAVAFDTVTVMSDSKLVFRFKDCSEVEG